MEGTTTTGIESVMGVIPDLFELGGKCFDAVLANPILLMFFSVGMIGLGLGVFSMLKRASKR